jgi:hypothetical protein
MRIEMKSKSFVISGIFAVFLMIAGVSCTKETVQRLDSSSESAHPAVVQPQSGLDTISSVETSPTTAILGSTESAGDRTGSGGDGLVCFNEDGSINHVKSWDYVEAEIEHGHQINLGEDYLSVREKMELVIDRIEKHENIMRSNKFIWLRKYFDYFKDFDTNQDDNKMIKLVSLESTDGKFTLRDIRDDNSRLAIDGDSPCKMVQLAMQEDIKREDRPFIKIHKELWDLMDNDHKAGLLLHELFLMLIRNDVEGDIKDTRNARYLNTAFSTSQYENIVNDETHQAFLAVLASADLGIYKFKIQKSPPSSYDEVVNGNSFIGYLNSKPHVTTEKSFNKLENLYEFFSVGSIFPTPVKFKGFNEEETISTKINWRIKVSQTSENGTLYRSVESYLFNNNLLVPYFHTTDPDGVLELKGKKFNSNNQFNSGGFPLDTLMKNACTIKIINNQLNSGVLANDTEFILENNETIVLMAGTKFSLDPVSHYLKSGIVYGVHQIKHPVTNEIVTLGSEEQYSLITIYRNDTSTDNEHFKNWISTVERSEPFSRCEQLDFPIGNIVDVE